MRASSPVSSSANEIAGMVDVNGLGPLKEIHVTLIADVADQTDKAAAGYKKILGEENPPSLRVAQLAGNFYERHNQPDAARAVYQSVAAIDDSDVAGPEPAGVVECGPVGLGLQIAEHPLGSPHGKLARETRWQRPTIVAKYPHLDARCHGAIRRRVHARCGDAFWSSTCRKRSDTKAQICRSACGCGAGAATPFGRCFTRSQCRSIGGGGCDGTCLRP